MISKSTLTLLRFPFSFLLMPIFFLVLSQTQNINTVSALTTFFIIHLLVYPASNGYNSYVDKDTSSIGGLEKPPMPTTELFYTTLFLDIAAILLSLVFSNPAFALAVSLYILASRAYSSRTIRLKKYPFTGFLVVAFFQGAFTYYMLYTGISSERLYSLHLYAMLASSFQIAGVYPLTQIYQHKADLEDEVITISYKLGYKGTFIFSSLMFLVSMLFYFLHFKFNNGLQSFYILQIFFLPALCFFIYWFIKVLSDTRQANFKHTMRMNVLAASSLNCCFILLTFLK